MTCGAYRGEDLSVVTLIGEPGRRRRSSDVADARARLGVLAALGEQRDEDRDDRDAGGDQAGQAHAGDERVVGDVGDLRGDRRPGCPWRPAATPTWTASEAWSSWAGVSGGRPGVRPVARRGRRRPWRP